MGNRALTSALSIIAETEPHFPRVFKHVFLAAPDIDVPTFKQLAKTFPGAAEHFTMYESSKDKALLASKVVHSGPRVGDTIVIVSKVDTIDASAVSTDFIDHSYIGDNRTILSDLFNVLRTGDPPGKRFGMRPNDNLKPTYWLFRP
jgi:esterase/lipase superfamily enzyme